MQVLEFPREMHESLKYCVYRLIDPRNGLTFYIGKGRRNRVFDHVMDRVNFSKEEDEDEGDVSAKMHVIRDIKASGLNCT